MNAVFQARALPPQPVAGSLQFINLCKTASSSAVQQALQHDLTQGLLAPRAQISPKFFYDTLGSRLFEAITALPEYYPTRIEADIFHQHAAHMAQAVAACGIQAPCLIDLGAGNCAKAARWMPYVQPTQYVPVDISVDFVRVAATSLQARFPSLDIVGVGMDFSASLQLPLAVQAQDRVFFYPGSSLGNWAPAEALRFLQAMIDSGQGRARGLLLGIDLLKDPATLEAAYDDAVGVTAAFNKNVLRHVNRLLSADFDLRQWQHVALFNAEQSRIEMHLQATQAQTVRWQGYERHFAAGERIHTENSYKYSLEGMDALLRQAGFAHVQHWTDAQGWFAVFWAAV